MRRHANFSVLRSGASRLNLVYHTRPDRERSSAVDGLSTTKSRIIGREVFILCFRSAVFVCRPFGTGANIRRPLGLGRNILLFSPAAI